jgi:hypothetical protein
MRLMALLRGEVPHPAARPFDAQRIREDIEIGPVQKEYLAHFDSLLRADHGSADELRARAGMTRALAGMFAARGMDDPREVERTPL